MQLNGAQIIIEELCAHGVTTVFGYPGGAVLPLYDALYENAHRVNHVITAHEQGASHAADGYARASGKTGVVIATGGPGATNLVTGIANAYLDSVPFVAITGNVAVPLLGRDSFQEVDIVGVTQPIVKHSFAVHDVTQLTVALREAFAIANSGRKGPVLVDVPKSVQSDLCEYEPPDTSNAIGSSESGMSFSDVMPLPDLTAALQAIKSSKKPYIYAGGGIVASEAEAELLALSKRLSAPVGLSMMGLTALPNSYELNLGMCGMHGKYGASKAQSECDLMVAVGVRFSDRATGNIEEYRKNHTIIHIDIDLAEIDKNVSTQIDLCGDAKAILTALLSEIPAMKKEQWLQEVKGYMAQDQTAPSEDFTPRNIIRAVNCFCGNDTVIATDVGQHQMWITLYYPFEKPRTLLTSGGLGAMGYGMGAAIGGCMATDNRRTVLFTGDGSFGMNLTELATAVTQKLPLVIVVMDNGVLGMVRQWQTLFYEARYSQTSPNRKTDFAAVAEAFGAEGRTATSLAELQDVLNDLDNTAPAGPTVIHCRIDPDEKVLPMIPPGGSIKNIVVKE